MGLLIPLKYSKFEAYERLIDVCKLNIKAKFLFSYFWLISLLVRQDIWLEMLANAKLWRM
jgi:hypothetical protein